MHIDQLANEKAAGGAAGARRGRAEKPPRKLHAYFVAFSVIFASIVLVGFSRTFFIPVAQGHFSRPLVVHIHGALFFAWTGLLVAQAILAATRRLRLHRRLGSVAGWLILPMLAFGALVAARDAVQDYQAGQGDAALSFFFGELADLAMFGVLAGAAKMLRNKPEHHKRLVVLGSVGLLGAAFGRISALEGTYPYVFIALVSSVAIYDLMSRRAVHAATLASAAFLFLLNFTEAKIGDSNPWLAAAHRLLDL